jgi:hypothetical protein
MYVIDNATRAKIYNGGLYYTPIVKIGDITIPNSEIKHIDIDEPIIDTTNQTMYIGTFVAKKLDIEFRTLLNIDLSEQITYSIEINDNGTITEVPIGVFNVETSPADYYKTYKITALDNSVKFKNAFDFESEYTITEDEEGNIIYSITAIKALQAICELAGITLNQLDSNLVNTTATTGYYDSTMSGKQWVSYIAEIMGGFAKIDRTGNLSIIPVKTTPVATINGLASKSFKIDELYKITCIRWENGVNIPIETTAQTNDGNTLYIRSNNVFVSGTDEERQQLIDNIGTKVLGLEIQSLTTENYADFTLDSTDIVSYTLGNNTYQTYYANSFSFKGSIMGKVSVSIPSKNQEQTTNVVESDETSTIRGIKTEINQLKATLSILASETQTNAEGINQINSTLYEQNSTRFRFVVQEQIQQRNDYSTPAYTDENGNTYGDVQYTNQQGYTFDKDGLGIAKVDGNGNYIEQSRSRLNGLGLKIIENSSNDTILFAGYNQETGESIVDTQNTTIRHYLNLNDGTNNIGRFETYLYDDNTNSIIDNTKRVGFFWLDS